MCINTKLNKLRNEISVNKSKYNSHGKFKYRSLEDIYVAIKPMLSELEVGLSVNSDIVEIAGQIMVKSIVTLTDLKDQSVVSSSGFALHALQQTGMQAAMLSGSTTSYSVKYALSNLLLLDDNEDIDSLDNKQKPLNAPKTVPTPKTIINTPKVVNPVKSNSAASGPKFNDSYIEPVIMEDDFEDEVVSNEPAIGSLKSINGFTYILRLTKDGRPCYMIQNKEDHEINGAPRFVNYQ